MAEALGTRLSGANGVFDTAFDFDGSTFGGAAAARVGRSEEARAGAPLGAFLRWAGSGGERGRVGLSEDLVAWIRSRPSICYIRGMYHNQQLFYLTYTESNFFIYMNLKSILGWFHADVKW